MYRLSDETLEGWEMKGDHVIVTTCTGEQYVLSYRDIQCMSYNLNKKFKYCMACGGGLALSRHND